jgi:signal transduction histidine kinase
MIGAMASSPQSAVGSRGPHGGLTAWPLSGVPAPSRAELLRSLLLLEVALIAVEVLWIGVPLRAAAADLRAPVAINPAVLTLAGALWLATLVRLLDGLRPLLLLLSARARKETVSASTAEAANRVFSRLPVESGVLHFLSWLVVIAAALALAPEPNRAEPLAFFGLASAALFHAAGASAVRALVLSESIGRLRAIIFPTLEGMRVWSAGYRAWLILLGIALWGAAHLYWWLLAMTVGGSAPQQRAALSSLLWAVVLPGAALWTRSLRGRVRAIEVYLDVTLRSPGTRGPARDEPKAVAAFKVAQSLPYRLGGYYAFVLLLAGVVAVAASRRLLALPFASALHLLGALALVVAMSALYGTLLCRQVLRPLIRHLGSRHALPVAQIRSRVGLRPKLLTVFAVVALGAAGLIALGHLSAPGRWDWAMAGLALGGAALIGLTLLVTRELVVPIGALEARSEEMARGELARPVPPSGEADEIGRLSVAFEEMRRALRDRLRSTESINIDLEREVRRRTEALEQKNAELHAALDKLRRAQDNLVRSEKLASVGRLVAGIAHEINNPVNAVINSLGPLQETLVQIRTAADGELVDTAQEMLGVIQRGAARTKAIVQALHNYSRGEEAAMREVSLARSIDDSLDLLRHPLRQVKVIKEVEAGARITGFPGQIDQVLINLLTNAAQAMGEKGGTIRVGARERADGVEMFVSDDGPGIPPEVLPRIFDPFFTTKDVGEGSGLGLSIVHGIVDRHGGKIDVDSAPGRGTTFRVLFPPRALATSRTTS